MRFVANIWFFFPLEVDMLFLLFKLNLKGYVSRSVAFSSPMNMTVFGRILIEDRDIPLKSCGICVHELLD